MDGDDRIGYQVQVKLEKSRFGTTGRKCHFNILFTGQNPGIQDEESWLDALMGSDNIVQSGAWYTLVHKDGTAEKFQSKTWTKKLQDDKFKERVFELMDDEIVKKYDQKMEKVDSKGE
jgi:hypothetical protein